MKILLSAYSCGPTPSSEPGNAWRILNLALAEGHEVWTVTHQVEGYEGPTRAHMEQNPMPGYHPVFFKLPLPLHCLNQSSMGAALHYHLWQSHLVKFAMELHRKIGFDLAHHVTFGRYWTPSGVRNLGIPFIWGPIGAAESSPTAFNRELPVRDQLFELLRDSRHLFHYLPSLRETARKATISFGSTRESCEAIHSLGGTRVVQLPLSVRSEEELSVFDDVPPPSDGPLRLICLGRLLHWKGYHLAIRAFAIFARTNAEAELCIVGDGPFRKELEKTIAVTGMQGRVRLLGNLPHEEAMNLLAKSHLLLHPALHDNFPGVCLEAMASGRPVVCLDIGGPAVQVTPETGFVAPATTPKEAVEAMAAFLTRVDGDRSLLQDMSAKARVRVRQEFSLKRMGERIKAAYAEVMASSPKG